jgi:HEAT repeat protein
MKCEHWIRGVLVVAVVVRASSVWAAETTAPSLGEFMKQIQSKTENERRAAWEKCGPVGAQALAPLAKLLVDYSREGITTASKNVSKAAGSAMDVIAHYVCRPGAEAERKAVNAELVKLIAPDQPEQARIKAFTLLASTGQDDEVAVVAAQMKDSDAKMRERARGALERIPGKASLQALLAALPSATGEFRRDIIETLGHKRAPEAVDALLAEAGSDDAATRLAAVDALARIGDPRGREAILAAVTSLEGIQRKTATDDFLRLADNLAAAGDSQAAMGIYRGVLERSKNDASRCAALVGVGKAGGSESLSVLLNVLNDPSAKVRNAAVTALVSLQGADANQRLAEATQAAEPATKAMLLRVLAERKAPEADKLLKEASRDRNMDVRVTALDLLGGLDDPSLEPLLLEAAEKGSAEVKTVALRGYVKLAARLAASDKSQGLAMYNKALALAATDEVRRSALEGVGALGGPESLPNVEKLMNEGNVRDDAARAYISIVANMGKTGNKDEAIKRLMAVVENSRSQSVSAAGIAALRGLGAKVAGLARKVGFITEWWIVGPFPFGKDALFDKSFVDPEKVAVDQPVKFDGKELKWKQVKSDDAQGLVDLRAQFRPNQNVAAYAYAEIEAPRNRPVNLRIGSDDGFICWVNGKKVGEDNATRPLKVDENTLQKVQLVEGTNKILLKITQGGGEWAFCVRVANPQNRPIDLNRMGER